ncbi:MAG: nucleic acid binding OB-fold tRNA/helicase-type, partial [Acidimicrobiaceae bacterium]|nr:nucleic acid binding OB-fold tRNA/helicase-type [Acidimicrobiaceae bacterium]
RAEEGEGADGRPISMNMAGQLPEWAERPPPPPSSQRAPESRSYRLKRVLLGPPLSSDQLHGERLGKPTALAVLSSDVMSSCAYATESVLRILVPAAGLAAFALVTPVTLLLLFVLGLVCLCYRQVVKSYPVSGGSYVVSRESFGFSVAQIPAAALLCSYVLTVAVSVAAGVDALISAFPALSPYPVECSVVFVLLITYGNLRGIREAGRVFAVPTYWFIASMGVLLLGALVRLVVQGHLHRFVLHAPGHVAIGTQGGGLLLGASLFLFLRAFANGGSAMTGMEAISNAVTVFREPQVRNARTTLVSMAAILGVMFLGVSLLASATHAVPFASGTPTVLSQIGNAVFGPSTLGRIPYYSLQFSTALILVLGANTSFNGFPLLVSYIAEDAYLPRPLTKRGHRLVYSNGIFALAAASLVVLLVTRAQVASLIPLYACTVFTGFTMAGAGMVKHHLDHRGPNWQRDLAVAATALVASAVVTLIFVVTEFTRGAWLVVLAIPLLVLMLTRTHHRYDEERLVLAEDLATPAPSERVLRRHVVVVLIDRLDLASARGLQMARSLTASADVRAVHFRVDAKPADKLSRAWSMPGLAEVPLEIIDCPDRRVDRAAADLDADLAADGYTEVTLVKPRRARRGLASRVLHDRTADRIVAAVGQLPHVSATIAPFDVAGMLRERFHRASLRVPPVAERNGTAPTAVTAEATSEPCAPAPVASGPSAAWDEAPKTTPLGGLAYRQRALVVGRVRSMRVQPWSGVSSLECTLVDDSGAIDVVFLGRRSIPGLEPGSMVKLEGMVGTHRGRLAMINPRYDLVAPPGAAAVS